MNLLNALVQLLINIQSWTADDVGEEAIEIPTLKTNDPVQNYQIDVLTADSNESCYEVLLMEHEFGASWGQPYSVPYKPPQRENDSLPFNYVKFKMDVDSYGIQYDRLAHIFINGIELWRPSTSEPRGKQSHSSFTKDVSVYKSLLSEEGEFTMELDNLVTARLNGTFSVKVWAQYFCTDNPVSSNAWYEHESKCADRVSSVVECKVATDSVRAQLAGLPRNTTRAILELFASGNGNDEFWYAQSSLTDEDDKVGPIRHLTVTINDDLAGVVIPFYQIYTGGFQPALWSPFVAPNAYDVPSYHIDLTPFLPSLWRDKNHNLTIAVTNQRDDEVRHEWIISANMLTWESEEWCGEGGSKSVSTQANTTDSIVLPSIEMVSFKQSLVSAARLTFRNIRTGSVWHQPVNFSQEHSIDATIVGETVISHESHGVSTTAYDLRNYSLSYRYDLALILNDTSIIAAVGYDLHEHSYSNTEDLLSRSHGVHYNGSWHLESPAAETSRVSGTTTRKPPQKQNHRHSYRNIDSLDGEHDETFNSQGTVNGSDVFVKYRDPQRSGKSTLHRHAISRNGSVVSFNSPLSKGSDTHYKKKAIHASASELSGFPFVSFTDKELERRRAIRMTWLHHVL